MRRRVDILAGDEVSSKTSEMSRTTVEINRRPGAATGARVVTVPTGSTGWDQQPDGTLWVEYNPA